MTTYYVNSGAAGANTGGSWTDAFLLFSSAVTAATVSGDIIKVQYTHQEELAADVSYLFLADITVVSVNKDSSDALTSMGAGGWLGNSTTNRGVSFGGADKKVLMYGLTVRLSGASVEELILNGSAGAQFEYQECYFWISNTITGTRLRVGISGTNGSFTRFKDCVFRFGAVGQALDSAGQIEFIGGYVSSAGAVPTSFIRGPTVSLPMSSIRFVGFDTSSVAIGYLVTDSQQKSIVVFDRCKFHASTVPMFTQSTNPTAASPEVTLIDCSSGDVHGTYGFYNALGSITTDSGVFLTAGPAAVSWKIVTTANANYNAPFVTPSISLYNTDLSAITPYFEVLRDGSTTALTDEDIWPEYFAKTTSGTPMASYYASRMPLLGTPANHAAGAGAGAWTGEGGTVWSGIITSGAAFTPAEVGDITGRICVGIPSTTIFVEPYIRTS